MASDPQDLSSAPDEFSRDSGDPFFNNYDFPSLDPSGNVDFDEWVQRLQEDANVDKASSLPAQTSTHQGASDVVDQDAPGTSATSLFNNPFGDNLNNDLLLNHSNNVDFDKWVQGVDTASSLPAQTSTHQGAPDVVDQDAPGTSATSLFNTPFMNNPNVLSEEISPLTPLQDSESTGALNAAGAYGPTSLGPSTPKKRKRSNEEAYPPSAPKTYSRKRRNSTRHDFSQKGSPLMIIDGQPCYVAPAGVPSGSKTTVAADGMFNLNNSERYLDSNRMRQMIKNGLADRVGIVEGERWECRLPGGVYRIECLPGGWCSMQWFGEVAYV